MLTVASTVACRLHGHVPPSDHHASDGHGLPEPAVQVGGVAGHMYICESYAVAPVGWAGSREGNDDVAQGQCCVLLLDFLCEATLAAI